MKIRILWDGLLCEVFNNYPLPIDTAWNYWALEHFVLYKIEIISKLRTACIRHKGGYVLIFAFITKPFQILLPSLVLNLLIPPHCRCRGYCFSWPYSQTYLVWLLCTSDQPGAETSTSQHTTLTTHKHPRPRAGFEHTIPAGERPQTHVFRPRGHWDRRLTKRIHRDVSRDQGRFHFFPYLIT